MLGVIRSAMGKRCSINAFPIPLSESASPLVATITGSHTINGGLYVFSLSATALIISAVGNIPSFTASISTSSKTASICFSISQTGTLNTEITREVFSATTDVITDAP